MSGKFESLEELLNKVDVRPLDDKEYLFRGHSNSEYLIQPSIFRINNATEHDIYSYIMTEHYDVFKGMKPLEVLSKMQHVGVATRLLDLTQNPLVGLFFAVDSFSLSKKQEKVINKCCIKSCPFFRSKCTIIEGAKKKRFTRFSPSFLSRCKCRYSVTKKSNPELLVFPYEKGSLKEYDSDTIKLLSCLPLLKEEKQKQLLIDAINEYLIDVSLKLIFDTYFPGFDYEADLQEIISFIKDYYYLSEKYDDSYGFLSVLRSLGNCENDIEPDFYWIERDHNNSLNSIKYKVYQSFNSLTDWRFDISKTVLMIEYRVNDQSSYYQDCFLKINIEFERRNNQSVLYKIVKSKFNNCIYVDEIEDFCSEVDLFEFYNIYLQKKQSIGKRSYGLPCTKIEYESLFSQCDDYEGYQSKSMEELHYKVKDFYPDFRRCASTLDVINGVYVYPIVNTDRMRAQKGLFALYGLSQYWNFKRYMEYQKSNNVEFYEAINLFLENNLASQKERKSVDIRKMEDYIYGIERVSIDTNKATELKSALKKLGIDKETLGCSLETTYNKYIED